MKWTLVGKFAAQERPLWSSFVWRNELADTFVEVLAVPWLIGSVNGTPWLTGVAAHDGRVDRPGRVAGNVLVARVRPGRTSATEPRSTGAAWCKLTCSMIES